LHLEVVVSLVRGDAVARLDFDIVREGNDTVVRDP
jgi:hypothetical protein